MPSSLKDTTCILLISVCISVCPALSLALGRGKDGLGCAGVGVGGGRGVRGHNSSLGGDENDRSVAESDGREAGAR